MAKRRHGEPPEKRCESCYRDLFDGSITANDDTWKACPCCSRRNGRFHVFLRRPMEFGERRPGGGDPINQSHCKECRSAGQKNPEYCWQQTMTEQDGAMICGNGIAPD
jgi:hypothetical protein